MIRTGEEVPKDMKKANDSGQTLLELAICLSVFMMLLLGTMDFGRLYSTKMTLQNSVRQAARYAITGDCIMSGSSCQENRYNSILTTLEAKSDGIINSSNEATYVTITCINEGGGCPDQAGGPGDVVTIQVSYPYKFLTPVIGAFFTGDSYTLNVGATFTNEHFLPSQS